MTRVLKFYGASDDLFEIEGTTKGEPEEIGCYDRPGAVKVYDRQGNGLIVTGLYIDPGVWSIGIAPMEENQPLPGWPHSYGPSARGYSALLTIDAPDDAIVVEVAQPR